MNGDIDAAREALNDMPPRAEEELDPVGIVNFKCLRCSSMLQFLTNLIRVQSNT